MSSIFRTFQKSATRVARSTTKRAIIPSIHARRNLSTLINIQNNRRAKFTNLTRICTNSFRRQNLISQQKKYNSSIASQFEGIGKLNHIAIACPDLEDAVHMYKNVLLAKSVSRPVDLPEHGVTTVFVTLGEVKIELLHPLGENSPIEGYLKKNKNGGLHHICLEVEDIHAAVAKLKEEGKRVIGEIKTGAHGLPVIFVHPKSMGGVLVELEEVTPEVLRN